MFVKVVGISCRNWFFDFFSPVFDIGKVTFIGIFALECLCAPYFDHAHYKDVAFSVTSTESFVAFSMSIENENKREN